MVNYAYVQDIVKSRGLITACTEKPMSDFSRHGIISTEKVRQIKIVVSSQATSFPLKLGAMPARSYALLCYTYVFFPWP
jgi:hypothetical protein